MRLFEGARPDDPDGALERLRLHLGPALLRLNGEIGRQAMMVSYTDSFRLLFVIASALTLLVVLLRTRRN